jgi:hypothetical protein
VSREAGLLDPIPHAQRPELMKRRVLTQPGTPGSIFHAVEIKMDSGFHQNDVGAVLG